MMDPKKNIPIGVCERCRRVRKACCNICQYMGSVQKKNTKSCMEWLQELKCLLEQLLVSHKHCSNTYQNTELERILKLIKVPIFTKNLKIEEYPNLEEVRLVNRKLINSEEVIEELLSIRHNHKQSVANREDSGFRISPCKKNISETSRGLQVSPKEYSSIATSEAFNHRAPPTKVSQSKEYTSKFSKDLQVLKKDYSSNAPFEAFNNRASPTKVSLSIKYASKCLKGLKVSNKENSNNAPSEAFNIRASPTKVSPSKGPKSKCSKDPQVSKKEYSSKTTPKAFNNRAPPTKVSSCKEYMTKCSKGRQALKKEYSSNASLSKSSSSKAHSTKVTETAKICEINDNGLKKFIQNEQKCQKGANNTGIIRELDVIPSKGYISNFFKKQQLSIIESSSIASPSKASNKASSTKILEKVNQVDGENVNGQTNNVQNEEKTQKGSKTVMLVTEKSEKSELTIGGVLYQLSNKKFIDIGWTQMPTHTIIRRINIYEMELPNPETGWFEENKSIKVIHYNSGEKLAYIDGDGCGTLFYIDGTVAMTYNNDKDKHDGRRYTVYNRIEFEMSGNSQTELAVFDFSGNGVIYDGKGNIRLKYNQSEGVVVDPKLGPKRHWKWHTLNDPPVLQEITVNHHLDPLDPHIEKIGHKVELKLAQAKFAQEETIRQSGASSKFESKPGEKSGSHPNVLEIVQAKSDAQMKEIVMNNFVKNKLKSCFTKFNIKMRAIKLNDNFAVKIFEQSQIFLMYRNGLTCLKFDLGLNLNGCKIVDAVFFEASDVFVPYGKHAERLAK